MNTNILVVEDEKVVSTYFKTYFGKMGYEVAVASSGEEARALLAYLVLQDGRSVSRDLLANLLWSYSDHERARQQ